MEFKGIDIHNCKELVLNKQTGGYQISRLPMQIADKLSANTFVDSGVELRFVPVDDEVRIVIRKTGKGASRVVVYYGAIQSGWQNLYKDIYDTPTEIVIPKAPNLEKLQKVTEINGYPYAPEVVRVVLQNAGYEIFDVKGRCVPPLKDQLPKKTYLAYGSSITHGSLAVVYPNTYVFRLGEYFKADTINLGFAGNARLEKEMADYIAKQCDFDFATLEMGINILNIDVEDFRNRVTYFVSTIAKAHPLKKIFCIDVFFMEKDVFEPGNPESKPNLFRKTVREVIKELNLPNIVYISGLEMLTSSKGLSQDLLHPNARGVEELSGNLCNVMSKYLGWECGKI